MFSRYVKILATALLGTLLWFPPAYAQKGKTQTTQAASGPKPVVQYIVVVVLLAIPIGLICRSSRRST
jgi:hypothetical protein